jgi:hypothetical protein
MTDVSVLFPLTVEITQDMINASNPRNGYICQGAIALRKALGDYANGRRIVWGHTGGRVDDLSITTADDTWMPSVISPRSVTFVLKNPKPDAHEKEPTDSNNEGVRLH